MFSSPPPPKGSKAPGKSPGWGFSLFSSAKKTKSTPAVGRNDTSAMNGAFSAGIDRFQSGSSIEAGLNNSVSSDAFMSPLLSPTNLSPGEGAAGLAMTNGGIGTGSAKTPRLDFSALSSRMSSSKFNPSSGGAAAAEPSQIVGEAHSPWQSRQNTTIGFSANIDVKPSPWQGHRSRRSRAKETPSRPLTFLSSGVDMDRARRYRPDAVILVGKRFGRRGLGGTGEFNPEKFSQSLASLKDSFGGIESLGTSTSILAVRGKVQWRAESRPSRLFRPSQKRQRPSQELDPKDKEGEEGTSQKRRKKVSFNQDTDDGNAVVTRITATPFRSTAQRKGTPMPSKVNLSTPGPKGETFVSPSDDGEEDELMSVRPEDNLPDAPPRLKFPWGKLDSNEPVSFNFSAPARDSFDAINLDPIATDLQLGWQKNSCISADASRSFAEKSEFEGTRYERPPSPVRELRKKNSTGDDDGRGDSQPKEKRVKVDQSDDEEKAPDWVCSKCETVNDPDESRCVKCDMGRTAAPGGPKEWGSFFKHAIEGKWKCDVCSVYNDDICKKCASCEALRLGMKADVGATPVPPAPATTSFLSATKNIPTGTAFIVGSSTPSLPVPTGKPEESQFTFSSKGAANGSGITASGFTFAGGTPGTPTPADGGFVFGATPTPVAGVTKSGFIFTGGGDTTKGTNGQGKNEDSSKTIFAFGTPASFTPAPAPMTGGFVFGRNKNTAHASSKESAPPPATEGKTMASATSKPFTFGESSGENGDKKAALGVTFGNATVASEPEGSIALFGTTAGKSSEETKAVTFPPLVAPAPPPFVFGQTNGAPSTTTGFTSDGGQTFEAKPAAPTPAPAFSFALIPAPATDVGKSSASALFGNTMGHNQLAKSEQNSKRQRGYDLKGTVEAEAKPATPAPTLFGAPATGPPSGSSSAAPVFKFGSISSDSASGSANEVALPALFGNSATAFGSSDGPSQAAAKPFSFGSASTPGPAALNGFGASSTPASGAPLFGSGTGAPTFGAATSSGLGSAPALGAGTTGFGSTLPTTTGMNFGLTAAAAPIGGIHFGSVPAPSSFGSTTAPPPAPPAAFGFGAQSGFAAANPPAATPVPAFGAITNTPSTGFGLPGAFGSQTTAAPSQGFNSAAFGNGVTTNTAIFPSTPAPSGGFGTNNFGAIQTGGFASTTTPATTGAFGFGAAGSQTAPQPGGFSMGSSGPKQKGRRILRGKRPSRA